MISPVKVIIKFIIRSTLRLFEVVTVVSQIITRQPCSLMATRYDKYLPLTRHQHVVLVQTVCFLPARDSK